MAEHAVSYTIPYFKLGGTGIEFGIERNAELFGNLRISKGGLVWILAGKQHGFKLRWSSFDRMAQEKGSKVKVKRKFPKRTKRRETALG